MPLQGVFNADFTSFTTACAQAEVSLKGFEAEASKTEAALNKMADSISGEKIVQQAYLATKAVEDIGGAANLTEKELERMSTLAGEGVEKLTAMGQTVPADMQALADATKETADNTGVWGSALSTLAGTFGALSLQRVIDEVVALGKAVFEDASQLENLQGRTGISVETLQRLREVGSETGVSLDAMATAVNRLQKNIGEGSSGTAGALAQLGLAFDDIKRMSPEDKFYAVSDALKQVEDEDQRVALGTQLLGKGFTDVLPAIKHGFDDVKDSAAGMSTSTVGALDAAAVAAHNFYQAVKDNLGEAMADILTLSTSQWRALKDAMQQLPQVAPPIANMWGQILPPSVPKDMQDIIDKSDAWGKETKAVNEAMIELDSAGKGWQGTLDTIDGTVVEAIKYYLDAGVSQQALATAFGLTDVQVKAVDASMKAYAETLKAVQKIEGDHVKQAETNYLGLSKAENDFTQKSLENWDKHNTQIEALNQKLTDDYNRQTMDRATYENLKLWESADAQITAFQKTGATAAQVTEFANKLYEDTAIKASELTATSSTTLTNITQQGIDDMNKLLAAEQQTLDAAAQQAADAAKKVADSYKQIFSMGGAGTDQGLGMGTDSYGNKYYLQPGQTQFGSTAPPVNSASGLGQVTFRAAGGPVTAGQSYVVGESGPELYTPGATGFITPNRVSGGGATSITINVTQPFGTPEAIARAVADAQVALMRGQGVRLPYGT